MSDLDFSKPASEPKKTSIYDPAVAMEFFGSTGKTEVFKKGATIFAENEKGSRLLLQRDKMYLLLDGEINMISKKQVIGVVKKGEIFGELASISHAARSAAAVASIDCRVISLDDKQLQNALRSRPDFALSGRSARTALRPKRKRRNPQYSTRRRLAYSPGRSRRRPSATIAVPRLSRKARSEC
jgi:CRP-like cAMP-binding protein